MRFLPVLLCCLTPLALALEGLYYQLYTDAYVAKQMQPLMSCVTAIFDDRGFYVFNGYNIASQTLSKYKGQLVPSYRNRNCFDMKPSMPSNSTMKESKNKICLFPVDSGGNYVVVSNGDLQRTFILTRYQPDALSPSLSDPDFILVNQTLQVYNLPVGPLLRTNHSSCFFYPPKTLDYVIKKPTSRFH